MSALNDLVSGALNGVTSLGRKRALQRTAQALPDAAFTYVPAAKYDRFSAGFGKEVLLPPDLDKRTYYIAGYHENNPARGVIDPQYASALWLDDHAGNGGILLVSLDVVGLLRKDVEELNARLADFKKLTGCRRVTVVSTHNHAGIDTMGLWGKLPFTGKSKRFMEILFSGVKKAAFAAYHDRREGRLYHGAVTVPDMQEDIRTPVVYSKVLTRLRFVPDDGAREIWLLNFAAHCESLQGCNSLVSADYPCYLRERIRQKTGAETLFSVGAVGGMISMRIENEDRLRRERRLLESTRAIGYRLADYAVGIKKETPLAPRISSVTQEFYVSVENPLLTIAGQLGIIGVDRYHLPYDGGLAAVKTQLTYMEIDSLHMLFLPCELFPELAYGGYLPASLSAEGAGDELNPDPLVETAGDEDLLIFGLADDELGYVIPPNDFYLNPDQPYLEKGIDRFGRRHYEETNSAGPRTAQAVSDAFYRVMRTVNAVKREYENENGGESNA